MSYNKNAGYGNLQAHLVQNGVQATGKIFVVAATTNADYDRLSKIYTPDNDGVGRLFTTIDAAVNATTANSGDVIVVASNHTETISTATSINLDIAGITLVGLGAGNSRPTITLDTATTTTIPVSADNITVKNMIFTANFADIVSFFTLGAAANFTLDGCYFKATAADKNSLYVVDTGTTSNAVDGLTIKNSKWIEPDTATESLVKMDGDNADVIIDNNFVKLGVNNNTPALMAIITAKSVFNAQITNNRVFRLNTDTATGAILVTTDQSDNSGIIADNKVQHADTASELLITASSGFGTFENYASGVPGASGYLLPSADS